MRNILLGVLLVALAAAIVNKKMWKHRNFLMIVVGILVAMIAVSMMSGREGFQVTADPACTNATVQWPTTLRNNTISYNEIYMFGNDNNISFDTTKVNTASITNWDATLSGTVSGTSIQNFLPNRIAVNTARAKLANRLVKLNCVDRLRQLLIYIMATDTYIFPYLTKASSYTEDLNVNTEDRYLNFSYMLNENPSLRGANFNTAITGADTALTATPTPSIRGDNWNNSFNLYTLLQLVQSYYWLRANTPTVSDTASSADDIAITNEKVWFIGVWLEKASLWNIWPFSTYVGRSGILRRCLGIALRYVGHSATDLSKYTGINYQAGELIRLLFNNSFINNTTCMYLPSPVPPANATATQLASHQTNLQNIPMENDINFIWVCWAFYMLKLFAADLNYDQTTTITLPDKSTVQLITSMTFDTILETYVKPKIIAMSKIAGCFAYLHDAAVGRATPLTAIQVDTMLRNYLADDTKCLQPLSTDGIVDVIKNNKYPMDALSDKGKLIPALYTPTANNDEDLYTVCISMKRILTKSILDFVNTTTSPYPAYDKLSLGLTDANNRHLLIQLVVYGISRQLPNINMSRIKFPYLITNDIGTNSAFSGQGPIFGLENKDIAANVNTVKTNYAAYNDSVSVSFTA